jgi:hypothetical protein
MSARVAMFKDVGKTCIKVATILEQASAKSMAVSNRAIAADQRRELAKTAMKDQLYEIEVKYRSALVAAEGCSADGMPKMLYLKAWGGSCILFFFMFWIC